MDEFDKMIQDYYDGLIADAAVDMLLSRKREEYDDALAQYYELILQAEQAESDRELKEWIEENAGEGGYLVTSPEIAMILRERGLVPEGVRVWETPTDGDREGNRKLIVDSAAHRRLMEDDRFIDNQAPDPDPED